MIKTLKDVRELRQVDNALFQKQPISKEELKHLNDDIKFLAEREYCYNAAATSRPDLLPPKRKLIDLSFGDELYGIKLVEKINPT